MTNRPTQLSLLTLLIQRRPFSFVLSAILTLVAGVATLLVPLVSAGLITALQHQRPVLPVAAALALLGLGAALSGALASFLLARLSQDVLLELRSRTLDHSLRGPLREVERLGSGNLSTRLTVDAAQVKAYLETAPIQLPISALMLVATMTIMVVLDPVLLLITLGSFLLAIIVVGLVVVSIRRHHLGLQEIQGEMTQRIVGLLDNLSLVKACRAETEVLRKSYQDFARVRDTEIALARSNSLLTPTLNLAQQVALVGVLIGGSVRLVDGSLSLPALVAFLMYLLQLAAPLMTVVQGVSGIQGGLAARSRFADVFALEREPREPTTPGQPSELSPQRLEPELPMTAPTVRLENLTFGYGGESPVLTGVDLTASPGLTAIVGPSGAGKSTLLKLINRLYDSDEGRLLIGDTDLTHEPPHRARALVSMLDQNFRLIDGSIRQNLLLGLTTGRTPPGEPDDNSLYQALADVGLADVVRRTPDGLDTRVGRGFDLSGGQRQRLAMARLLLDPRPVVLLDEPTSQLDDESDLRLQHVIEQLRADHTVVVVAHRRSTIQSADQVVVVEAGQVLARGSHESLSRSSVAYRRLGMAVPNGRAGAGIAV